MIAVSPTSRSCLFVDPQMRLTQPAPKPLFHGVSQRDRSVGTTRDDAPNSSGSPGRANCKMKASLRSQIRQRKRNFTFGKRSNDFNVYIIFPQSSHSSKTKIVAVSSRGRPPAVGKRAWPVWCIAMIIVEPQAHLGQVGVGAVLSATVRYNSSSGGAEEAGSGAT